MKNMSRNHLKRRKLNKAYSITLKIIDQYPKVIRHMYIYIDKNYQLVLDISFHDLKKKIMQDKYYL